ncbi:hypothetical protein KAU43_02215, partial [candidate division WOR-3 bacterium]|nr:hypothetical protein [candidate division WOR-3 bacterium]
RNYYQDTFLNNVIEPNTEYKFIKNVRIHGNGNLNDTLRGDGHGAYYSNSLYLESDSDSIYIGDQNIDSIQIYSSDDWEYSKEMYINFNYSEEINTALDSIIGFGDLDDFECNVTGEIINNNVVLMKDSSIIFGEVSDTIVPLLGMNFFVIPSGNGIDLKFNPDSSYYKLFTSDNASNNYIKYTKWDVNIYYPNGEIHRDLFLNDMLGNYHTDTNVGHGGDCYFQPEIYWTEKMPEDYVILKTNNPIKTKYKLYYIQDSTIHPVDSILYQPMGDEDSILGYWDIASVYGNVRLLVFQGDTNAIDSIKYKDFHIGNIIDTNNGGTASSPYKRATLDFPGEVFAVDTLSKVVPIGFDTDNIGESSPYLGGNTGPVVKMYPMGKVFADAGHCPTLLYHFTDREISNQNIDVDNISLFSIGNNGEIRRVNASVMESNYDNDGNIMWTLTSRPEEFPKDGEHNYYAPLKDSETVELGFDIKKVKSLPDNKIAILLKSVSVDTGVIIPDTITITFVVQNRDSTGSINLLEKLNIYDIKDDSSGRGTFTITSYDIPIGNFRDNDSLFIIDSVPDEYSKVFVYGNHIDTSRGENDTIRNSEVKTFYLEGGYSLNVNKDSLYITRLKTDTISIHCKKDMNIYYTLSDQYGNEIFNKQYSPDNNGNMDIIWDGYIDNVPVSSGEYNAKIIIKDKDDYLVYSDNANWHIYFDYDLSISHPLSGIFKGDVTLLTFPLDVPPPVKWYIKYPSQAFEYYIGEENHSGDGFILDTREYSDGSNIWLIAEITDLYGFSGKDSVKITIDNSPPLISVIEEGVGYNTHYNSLVINCEFSDSLSGLAYCSYSLTFGNIPSRDNIPLENPILVLNSDT